MLSIARPGGRTWRVAHLRTFTWSANDTAFASKAGAAAPGATAASPRPGSASRPSISTHPLDSSSSAGDMTDAGLADEWAEFLDPVEAISGAGRTDDHASRQPRPEHRRSPQPGSARPAVQPGQAAAADADAVGARGHTGRAGAKWSIQIGETRPHPWGKRWRRSDSGSRRLPTPAACCWRGALEHLWDNKVSDDPAATRPSRRSWHRHPQFQRRDPFLVHQCAGDGVGRTDPQAPGSDRPISHARSGSSPCIIIWWNIRCRLRHFPSASAPP